MLETPIQTTIKLVSGCSGLPSLYEHILFLYQIIPLYFICVIVVTPVYILFDNCLLYILDMIHTSSSCA